MVPSPIGSNVMAREDTRPTAYGTRRTEPDPKRRRFHLLQRWLDPFDQPLHHVQVAGSQSERAARRRHCSVTVKRGERSRHGFDVVRFQRAGGQHIAPQRTGGKAAHAHGDIQHRPIAPEGRALRAITNLHHVEMQRSRKASIQA